MESKANYSKKSFITTYFHFFVIQTECAPVYVTMSKNTTIKERKRHLILWGQLR